MFTGSSGSITSPGYPNNYPNNARCRYDIRVRGNMKIVLLIHYVDLEHCCDKLRIQQTVSGSNGLVTELTGNVTDRNFTSAENRFILLFRSDGSVTKRGFRASYYAIRTGKWAKMFMARKLTGKVSMKD